MHRSLLLFDRACHSLPYYYQHTRLWLHVTRGLAAASAAAAAAGLRSGAFLLC